MSGSLIKAGTGKLKVNGVYMDYKTCTPELVKGTFNSSDSDTGVWEGAAVDKKKVRITVAGLVKSNSDPFIAPLSLDADAAVVVTFFPRGETPPNDSYFWAGNAIVTNYRYMGKGESGADEYDVTFEGDGSVWALPAQT